jgi:hypothetical protein
MGLTMVMWLATACLGFFLPVNAAVYDNSGKAFSRKKNWLG